MHHRTQCGNCCRVTTRRYLCEDCNAKEAIIEAIGIAFGVAVALAITVALWG